MIARTWAALFAALLLATSLRAADTYRIDPAHTSIGFSITHLVISKVHGRFNQFEGIVRLTETAPYELLAITGSIEAASIDTHIAKRDDHLRSADFFDVATFPQITFTSTRAEKQENDTVLVGKFTMHGVTREVRLPVTVTGPIKDPAGNTRIGLASHLVLNRKDYGLTWNKVLETGGLTVGEEVEITINGEAIKQDQPAP